MTATDLAAFNRIKIKTFSETNQLNTDHEYWAFLLKLVGRMQMARDNNLAYQMGFTVIEKDKAAAGDDEFVMVPYSNNRKSAICSLPVCHMLTDESTALDSPVCISKTALCGATSSIHSAFACNTFHGSLEVMLSRLHNTKSTLSFVLAN